MDTGAQTAGKQDLMSRNRWIENGHIFLWLIKDTCWAAVWKPGGIFMIVPTLGVAFYILWQYRHVRSEFFHNLAICLWIMANSVWMISEFFNVEGRPYAIVIFLIGLSLLITYYLFFFKKDNRRQREEVELEAEPIAVMTELNS